MVPQWQNLEYWDKRTRKPTPSIWSAPTSKKRKFPTNGTNCVLCRKSIFTGRIAATSTGLVGPELTANRHATVIEFKHVITEFNNVHHEPVKRVSVRFCSWCDGNQWRRKKAKQVLKLGVVVTCYVILCNSQIKQNNKRQSKADRNSQSQSMVSTFADKTSQML